MIYAAEADTCCKCALKSKCTSTTRRLVQRHIYEGALHKMNLRATVEAMRLRRCTVERPFAVLKYVIFDTHACY